MAKTKNPEQTGSWRLCQALAGADPRGSVADKADWVAQAIEQAEDPEGSADVPKHERLSPNVALRYIGQIRETLDKAEARLQELQRGKK